MEKTWAQVTAGDEIVCPRTGLVERVISVRREHGGRIQARTNRHDHNANPDNPVTVLVEVAAPPVSKGFECIECAVELVEFEGETCDDCAKALA